MVYEFLANGFEDIEALAPVDILRRGGVEIQTVSMCGSREVTSAHGVTIVADLTFEEANLGDAQLMMLPGGLPGATNLNEHQGLRQALAAHAAKGGRVAAICAAPMVLGSLGLLKGKRATCYPGFEKYMDGATYTADLYTVDGNVTTGRGPAATLPYAYCILESFIGKERTDVIREGMIYKQLMGE